MRGAGRLGGAGRLAEAFVLAEARRVRRKASIRFDVSPGVGAGVCAARPKAVSERTSKVVFTFVYWLWVDSWQPGDRGRLTSILIVRMI